MTDAPRPAEVTATHSRLLKSGLDVEDARAYWQHADGERPLTALAAFEQFWFGARGLHRLEELLASMRHRYDAFAPALPVLHRWPHMPPDTRQLVCHWHLQLADPLYRAFTGEFLVERRASHRPEVTRDLVVAWVSAHGAARWTMSTRIQFASKLLSAAHAAGLVATNRDPRPLVVPRVGDDALGYLLYLLRGVTFQGSLLANPYARSVGLDGGLLEDRLRSLPGLAFQRQGDLVDFGWRYAGLTEWAEAQAGGAASGQRAFA